MSRQSLKDFWTPEQRRKFDTHCGANAPTTHQNCVEALGQARPGKTKRDRARKGAK